MGLRKQNWRYRVGTCTVCVTRARHPVINERGHETRLECIVCDAHIVTKKAPAQDTGMRRRKTDRRRGGGTTVTPLSLV